MIAGAKHGDHTAFESLVERYMASAVAVARNYTANREDALELAQEAFYRVYKNLDRFREGERFAPWFYKILRNACLNFIEKRRRIRRFSIHATDANSEDYPLPDGSLSPPERAELAESQRVFWRALEALSRNHREIILLRHFEELDYASIAEVLEIPIGTVMSRLFHARQNLKSALESYVECTT